MKFKIGILVLVLFGLTIISCSSEENDTFQIESKFLKKITWDDGYWNKYFYDDDDKLILLTKTSKDISLDSTYYEYGNNGFLSRTLNRLYSGNLIVNTQTIYNNFDTFGSNGTYKIFLDDGTIFQEKTFTYTFSNNLIKSYVSLNLDGTKFREQIYNHNSDGNLINRTIIYYSLNNEIDSQKYYTFTEWDSVGLKTENLFFWDSYTVIPGIYMSNNNCLNRIENNTTYNYSFEYDNDSYISKYNLMDEGTFFTLEYY